MHIQDILNKNIVKPIISVMGPIHLMLLIQTGAVTNIIIDYWHYQSNFNLPEVRVERKMSVI